MAGYFPALWRANTYGSYTPPSGVTRTSSVNSGSLFFLPESVDSIPIAHSWKGKVETLNAKHGANRVRGNYLNPDVVPITGKYLRHRVGSSYTNLTTDLDILELHYDLFEFLQPLELDTRFELFWWYDSSTPKYRKWKNVEKMGISIDAGDNNYNNSVIFQYQLQFHLTDSYIYTTAPGS